MSRICSQKIVKCISSAKYIISSVGYDIFVMKPSHWLPRLKWIDLIVYLHIHIVWWRKCLKIRIALHLGKTGYPVNYNIHRYTSVGGINKCTKHQLSAVIWPEVKCWEYYLTLCIAYHSYSLFKRLIIILDNTRPLNAWPLFPYALLIKLLNLISSKLWLFVVTYQGAGYDCYDKHHKQYHCPKNYSLHKFSPIVRLHDNSP